MQCSASKLVMDQLMYRCNFYSLNRKQCTWIQCIAIAIVDSDLVKEGHPMLCKKVGRDSA